MLKTVLLLLGCVGAALSQTSYEEPSGYRAPNPGYGNPSYAPYASYRGDIARLIENITILVQNDEDISARLTDLAEQDEINSAFTDTFLKEVYPKLLKDEDAQNKQIEKLAAQATELLAYTDNVNLLNNTLEEIAQELAYLTGPAYERTQQSFERLEALDAQNDADLAKAESDLAANEERLRELEGRLHALRELIGKLTDTLHQVFDALNSEGAETAELTLTADEPVATKYLKVDFNGRRPDLSYGIVLVHISNHEQSFVYPVPFGPNYGNPGYAGGDNPGYAGSDKAGYGQPAYGGSERPVYGRGHSGYGPLPTITSNPSIYFTTDADYDQNKKLLTARLYDLSTGGWQVDKVVLNVVVFRVDDRIIKTYA